MATKKKAKRKKAKKGFLLNKGGLFNKSSEETINPTKKFIKNIDDDNDSIELTETGKSHFEALKKQKAIESMEPPLLLDDLFSNSEKIEINSNLFLDLENTEEIYKDVKYILKQGENFLLFTTQKILALDFALTQEEEIEYPYENLLKYPPLMTNNMIYFSAQNKIVTYNTETSDWKTNSVSGEITSKITQSENLIFVVTDFSKLVALNENFKEEWSFLTEGYLLNTPLISNEHIYVTSSDGMLYKLDMEGDIVWTYNAKSPLELPPKSTDNEIIITTMSGKLLFIDKETKNENSIIDLGFPLMHDFFIKETNVYIFNRRFLFKIDLVEHKIKEIITFESSIEKIQDLGDLILIKMSNSQTIISDYNFTNLNKLDFYTLKDSFLHANFLISVNEEEILVKTEL